MRVHYAVALTMAAAATAACPAEAPPPVADLAAEPTELQLPYPEYRFVELEWRPRRSLAPFEGRPVVFLHLLDGGGQIARTFDHPFPEAWRAGRPVSYRLMLAQSALAAPLPAGDYLLVAGLYDGARHRWPLAAEAGEHRRLEYRLGEVVVPQATPEPVRFEFAGGWFPIEPGADRQVLARRWLYGTGTLSVHGTPPRARVHVAFRVPDPEATQASMTVREGGAEPTVYLRTACSSTEWAVSGPGLHEVEMPLDLPALDEGPCTVELEPNFYLEPRDLTSPRSLVLEGLSWRPWQEAERNPGP